LVLFEREDCDELLLLLREDGVLLLLLREEIDPLERRPVVDSKCKHEEEELIYRSYLI
jgi:hypothetical protein